MTAAERDKTAAVLRGLRNRCPNCAEGRLLKGYLTIVEHCAYCGEPLGEYRAADGPAFFTITIITLLMVPMLGIGWIWFSANPVLLFAGLALVITLMTLILLRLIKGGFVGYLWAHDLWAHDERDPGA